MGGAVACAGDSRPIGRERDTGGPARRAHGPRTAHPIPGTPTHVPQPPAASWPHLRRAPAPTSTPTPAPAPAAPPSASTIRRAHPMPPRVLFADDPPRICTIAGSDPGGGAGVQADLKTVQAVGAYGLSVLTALTAQNTCGIQGISHLAPDFVAQQFASVTGDIDVDAFKIGMLANRDVAQAVADALRSRPPTSASSATGAAPIVLDPVMVSTSGSMLLELDAIETLLTQVAPQSTVLTPNLPEASAILHHYGQAVPRGLPRLPLPGFTIAPIDAGQASTGVQFQAVAMQEAARTIATCSGAQAVLLKGGHSSFAQADVQALLDYLGVEPLTRPVRVFGAPSTLSGPRADLLSEAEGVDSTVFVRPSTLSAGQQTGQEEEQQPEVAVVRTDLRPWSTVLIAQRAHPAEGLSVAPDVQGAKVVADVLYEAAGDQANRKPRVTVVIKPHVPTTATHGTGCTLSSAIAAYLAAGFSLRKSVLLATEYVQGGLLHGLHMVGRGKHPLNHAHALVARAVPRRRPGRLPTPTPADHGPGSEATLSEDQETAARLAHLRCLQPLTSQLVGSGVGEWTRFVQHQFVQELGRNELPLRAFQHFLTQDYLFLRHYANIWALAASKADDFALIRSLAGRSLVIAQEAELHIKFCAQWGISRAQLEYETTESRATLAYTRFVLDVGRRYAAAEMLVATLPCILGYAEAGRNLALAHPHARAEGNSYADWIETYAHERFQQGAVDAVDVLETLVEREAIAPARLQTLKAIFHSAVKLEQGMWDEAVAVGHGEAVL